MVRRTARLFATYLSAQVFIHHPCVGTRKDGSDLRGLARSRHSADFFRLAKDFEGQQNMGYCGPTTAVIVLNALRGALGQKGGGHISPLGAYDEASDSFLILDVNPNGHDWVWVPTALLGKSMRTRDVSENRGYLLVRETAAAPAGR